MEGVAEHHVVAEAATSGGRPLTVALVASGTNAGVRTSPWAVCRTPARARVAGSRARSPARAPGACSRGWDVLASLVDVAQTIGVPLLFVLIAVETMGIPVPGETALVTAARRRGRGQLSIEAVPAVPAAAAVLCDYVGFALGRHLGRGPAARPRPVPAPSPQGARHGRAVLRAPRRQGGLPRALGRGPADHVGVARRRQPDVVAALPALQRRRRDRLGGLRGAGLLLPRPPRRERHPRGRPRGRRGHDPRGVALPGSRCGARRRRAEALVEAEIEELEAEAEAEAHTG